MSVDQRIYSLSRRYKMKEVRNCILQKWIRKEFFFLLGYKMGMNLMTFWCLKHCKTINYYITIVKFFFFFLISNCSQVLNDKIHGKFWRITMKLWGRNSCQAVKLMVIGRGRKIGVLKNLMLFQFYNVILSLFSTKDSLNLDWLL